MRRSNKELVNEFVTRVDRSLKGQPADVAELLSPDAVVQVIGSTPISGIYRGTREIMDILVRSAAGRIASGSVRLIDAIGQGDRVGVFLLIRAKTHTGHTYNAQGDPAGCYFRLNGETIEEIRFYPDTTQVEAEIYERRFVPNTTQSPERSGDVR
jgi:ketosteroid isomerase-like protein